MCCFCDLQKVSKKDIVLEDAEGEESDEADLYHGTLTLPRSERASVANCCIICLDQYKKGDQVVWACTGSECPHAFHQKCIVKYFLKIQKKVAGTPCPCCRRDFTDLEVEKRQRKRDRLNRSNDDNNNNNTGPFRSCRWICPMRLSFLFERRASS